MRYALICAAGIGLGPAGAAAAGMPGHVVQTGEGLRKMCMGADKVKALSMMCHSYLNGYLDAAIVHDKGGRFCLGSGDKERLPTVAITWLNAHPDYLGKPAPEALAKLLVESYPCRK
jgi:hypothetical protein